jgi:hypothetical protein
MTEQSPDHYPFIPFSATFVAGLNSIDFYLASLSPVQCTKHSTMDADKSPPDLKNFSCYWSSMGYAVQIDKTQHTARTSSPIFCKKNSAGLNSPIGVEKRVTYTMKPRRL